MRHSRRLRRRRHAGLRLALENQNRIRTETRKERAAHEIFIKKQINIKEKLFDMVLSAEESVIECELLTEDGKTLLQKSADIDMPKIVFKSSYQSKFKLPERLLTMFSKIERNNPGWQVRYYSDDDGLSFLKRYFTSGVVNAFISLKPGAYKADLLRYCLLYMYGGIWSDLTQSFIVNLDTISKFHASIVLAQDRWTGSPGIYQAFIAARRRHPILLKCIHFIVLAYQEKYYGTSSLAITGPEMMSPIASHCGIECCLEHSPSGTPHIRHKYTKQKLIENRSPDHRQFLKSSSYYDKVWHKREVWQ